MAATLASARSDGSHARKAAELGVYAKHMIHLAEMDHRNKDTYLNRAAFALRMMREEIIAIDNHSKRSALVRLSIDISLKLSILSSLSNYSRAG
jgi:hypothetical protein